MAKLELEYRDEFFKAQDNFKVGNGLLFVTPPINDEYWVFRVKLYKDQAIIAFPKFSTMGIGFAIESDWNTNLPYNLETESIYKHIVCNKLYKQITKKTSIDAIQILQKACKYYKENEQPKEPQAGNFDNFTDYIDKLKTFVNS